MLIVEQRTSMQTAPVFIFNSDVAICEKIRETYLMGERIIAAAVVSKDDPKAAAELVRCLLYVTTHWGFPALLGMLDLEDLERVKIVISTDQANYEIYQGIVRKTVKLPMVVGHRLGLLNFLYRKLGFSAEFSIAMACALQKWQRPEATTKVVLSKGFLYPSEQQHRFSFVGSLFSIAGNALLTFLRLKV